VVSTSESKVATAGIEPAVAAALEYAGYGWQVFPLAAKRPRTRNGLKDATTDASRVRGWWKTWPGADLGVRTGAESALLVLDVDGDEGADTLFELEREHGTLASTATAITGVGVHYYFKHPGGEIRNSAGKLGPGLDVRGDGGYVVAPPSRHASGRRYEWDQHPEEAGIAAAPAWMLERLTERPSGRARPTSEWRALAANGVAAGARNHACARLAGHLLARGVDPFVCLELVTAWDAHRNRPPLGADEVSQTVRSIARAEARKWS
jgi:hypothetical protein